MEWPHSYCNCVLVISQLHHHNKLISRRGALFDNENWEKTICLPYAAHKNLHKATHVTFLCLEDERNLKDVRDLNYKRSQLCLSLASTPTCDSVWPGVECTSADLRWLALTLVEIKWICTQVDASFSPFLGHVWTSKETCESVWPTNAGLYTSSTCGYLRLLASPFDQEEDWKVWVKMTSINRLLQGCHSKGAR